MAAKIITVAGQKGGSGKTTVTMALAGTFGRRGKRVLVVDADPQGTAMRWASSAPEGREFPTAVIGLQHAGVKLGREVRKHVDNYDYIVIDCPPSIETKVPAVAMGISDLVLIPVRPSGPDVWATEGMSQLVADVRDAYNEDLQARLIANACRDRTGVTKASLQVLGVESSVPLMHTRLHMRTAYEQASLFGCAIQDLEKQELAVQEIQSLVDEVLLLIEEEALPSGEFELVDPVEAASKEDSGSEVTDVRH